MYFNSRVEAGQKLAEKLVKDYRYEDTVVLAVSPGGVVIGNEIAKVIHARMSMLLTEPIFMPGMAKTQPIGLIDQDGNMTYNNLVPTGVLEAFLTEMRSYVEEQKLQKLHQLTRAIDEEGFIDPQMFYGHNVLVVSDGFLTGLAFETARNYLKPINTLKLIAVAAVASVPAVDRLHVLADGIEVLDVIDNYLDTDHYFEDNTIPDVNVLMKEIIRGWK